MILEKNIALIQKYLADIEVLDEGETVTALSVPGEGNMNFTLRVTTNERSMIVKQSRPYVEKYPPVPAPADRAMREAEFYHLTCTFERIASMMPQLYAKDSENNILVMEDFGESNDFSTLYHTDEVIKDEDLKTIMTFVANLHRLVNTEHVPFTIENTEMRKLNHEHMYIYPFMIENGFNLDTICEGLQQVSLKYKTDEKLKAKIAKMGKDYLKNGSTLLHGDYFLGSWLRTSNGIKIIDPEFCFFGNPEFEIGVTIAHLYLADQPNTIITNALKYYQDLAPLDESKAMQCAGVEIMRRLLGLAQLPINLSLDRRISLLEIAYTFVLN